MARGVRSVSPRCGLISLLPEPHFPLYCGCGASLLGEGVLTLIAQQIETLSPQGVWANGLGMTARLKRRVNARRAGWLGWSNPRQR